MEKKFRKAFEKMDGLSFVTHVTGLNRPNTGKEDDECRFKAIKSSAYLNPRSKTLVLILTSRKRI
jgi:hypothetical protein